MRNVLKNFIRKFGLIKIISTIIAFVVLLSIMLSDIPTRHTWSWSLPLSGYIIVVDPGHGGPDGGAESKDGTQEKDINLTIATYLRDYLNEAGALVILSREKDTDLASTSTKGLSRRKLEDLQNRVKLANNSMADLFVSIHLNSIPSERWHGAQTFFYPAREENEEIAKSIQSELINNLNNTDRVPLPRNDILVLKYVEMPSIMVEAGFLSNPTEARLLSEDDYQQKVAFAIYQGLLGYYSEKDKQEETELSKD